MAVGTMRRARKHSPTPSELVSLPTRIFVRCRRFRRWPSTPREGGYGGRLLSFPAASVPCGTPPASALLPAAAAPKGRPPGFARAAAGWVAAHPCRLPPLRSRRAVKLSTTGTSDLGRGAAPATAWPEPYRRLVPVSPKARGNWTATGPETEGLADPPPARGRSRPPPKWPAGFARRRRLETEPTHVAPRVNPPTRLRPMKRPSYPERPTPEDASPIRGRPPHRRRTRRPASSADGPEDPSASDRCDFGFDLAWPRRALRHPLPSSRRRKRVPCHSAPSSRPNNKLRGPAATILCISPSGRAIRQTQYSLRYPQMSWRRSEMRDYRRR